MTEKEIKRIFTPPIHLYEEWKLENKKKAEEFVFTYLSQNKGKGKINNSLLYENGFKGGVDSFLKDISFTIENNLIDVLKKNKNYIELELTLSGKIFISKEDYFYRNYNQSSFLNKIWILIIRPITKAIKTLNPVWKSILAILISAIGGFLGYLLIEYYKNS